MTNWPALALAFALAATPGCFHYRVGAGGVAGANPSTFPRAKTLHALFWGLVQDESLAGVCREGEALASVRTTSNLGFAFVTVVTLGIWSPARVEYECVNQTPATGVIGG